MSPSVPLSRFVDQEPLEPSAPTQPTVQPVEGPMDWGALSPQEHDDRSVTRAAIRANYSAQTARQIGFRLLSKVDIAAEIATRVEESTRTAGIEIVDILLQLKAIAFSDLRKLFEKTVCLRTATSGHTRTASKFPVSGRLTWRVLDS